MSIIDRLGYVLKTYILDDDDDVRIVDGVGGFTRDGRYGDPDYAAAAAELNEFLRGGGRGGSSRESGNWEDPRKTQGWGEASRGAPPPESLRADFAELGVAFGADEESCKAAYKKLLKIHHPDRHAGHEGNVRKATEKSARINAAYENIAKWRASS